jgi:hypothetical protein
LKGGGGNAGAEPLDEGRILFEGGVQGSVNLEDI